MNNSTDDLNQKKITEYSSRIDANSEFLDINHYELPGGGLDNNFELKIAAGNKSWEAGISALGVIITLFKDVSSGADNLSGSIKKLLRQVDQIKDLVKNIDVFLKRLPLVIDRTVEEKFVQYVSSQLGGSIATYLETKEDLIANPTLTETDRRILEDLYVDFRKESQTLMRYGVPTTTILAMTYSMEDDWAEILGVRESWRLNRLRTIDRFIEGVISGNQSPAKRDSLIGYLELLETQASAIVGHLEWLDQNFSGKSRTWSGPWRELGRSGNPIFGWETTYERLNYKAVVSGNSDLGFTLQQSSSPERMIEFEEGRDIIPHHDPDNHKTFSMHQEIMKSNNFEKNIVLRKDLQADDASLSYANSLKTKLDEIKKTQRAMQELIEVYEIAQNGLKSRISTLTYKDNS